MVVWEYLFAFRLTCLNILYFHLEKRTKAMYPACPQCGCIQLEDVGERSLGSKTIQVLSMTGALQLDILSPTVILKNIVLHVYILYTEVFLYCIRRFIKKGNYYYIILP